MFQNCDNVGNEEREKTIKDKQKNELLYLSRGFGLAGKGVKNTLPLILAGLGPITVTQSTTNNNDQNTTIKRIQEIG